MNINSLTASAVQDAKSSMHVVQVLTEVLAEKMASVHGGDWRFKIDHEHGYIMIIPKPEGHVQPSSGRSAI